MGLWSRYIFQSDRFNDMETMMVLPSILHSDLIMMQGVSLLVPDVVLRAKGCSVNVCDMKE